MDRRSLLAGVSCSLLGGAAGCLDRLDAANGDADDGSSEVDLDCERFEGEFGTLSIHGGVAGDVRDATVIDLEETGILEYDVVEAEMEDARERWASEERGGRVGWVQLGNGDTYADVEALLAEYEAIESGEYTSRWYVTYRDDTYMLSLHSTPLPWGNPVSRGSTTSSASGNIEIHTVESVPGDADAIGAVESGLADREYVGEALAIAGCSDELEKVNANQLGTLVRYSIPPGRLGELEEILGDDHSQHVEYNGEIYRLELSIGEE